MTPKQQRFVDEYLIDLNQTRAAIRAGFSPKSAHVYAVELMANERVQAAIEKAKEARRKRTLATQDRVVEELKWLAYSRREDYEISDDLDDPLRLKAGVPAEAMRAVSSVKATVLSGLSEGPKILKIEYRLWDKPKSLALLMRHLGMFKEKLEVDHEHRVTIYIPDNGRSK